MGIFDSILALYLIVFLPAQQLWKSFRKSKAAPKSRAQRYLKSMIGSGIALMVLVISSWWLGRGPAFFGLDLPLTTAGLWGLWIAVILLAGLGVAGPIWEKKLDDNKRAEYLVQVHGDDTLPRTRAELRIFLVLAVVLGTGWEVMYRGSIACRLKKLK
jgi:hypothetical protein